MDLTQPSLAKLPKGNANQMAEARVTQDMYRALKCPNFAVTKTDEQTIAHHASNWTLVTWGTVYHNYLNCFNTASNACYPNVPGVYMITCQIPYRIDFGTVSANTFVKLAIMTPAGVVRADSTQEFLSGSAASGITTYLNITCLDYLDGKGENAYRVVKLFNNTGRSVIVQGSASTPATIPRFQAFKISY